MHCAPTMTWRIFCGVTLTSLHGIGREHSRTSRGITENSPRCKHVMEERQRGMRHFLPTITMPKTSLYLKVNYFCQFRFLFSNVIHSFCDFFHVTKHKKTILHFFKHEFQPPIRFAHLNSGYTFFFCSRFSLKTAKLFDFSVESDN